MTDRRTPDDLPTPILTLTTEHDALPAGGGRVDALVRLEVGFAGVERDRDPMTLALVIDRSGSMGGEPLAFAKRAAQQALTVLQPGDAVAVVAFDTGVQVVVPATVIEDDLGAIHAAIDQVGVGGTTALHAGWLEGVTQALALPNRRGPARVILLSDGCANVGLTDAAAIAQEVAEARSDMGVTTSAVGLGRHFDERLMRAVADAGGGSYSFVASPDELPELFETEFAMLSALRGRNVRLAFDGADARFVRVHQGATLEDGRLALPELVAGLPRQAFVTIAVDGDALPPLRLTWDDAFTGLREASTLALDLPALGAAALAGRPAHPTIVDARRRSAFAERVQEVEQHVAAGRFDHAANAIGNLRNELATWPDDATRSARLADLEAMLAASHRRDRALADKLTHRVRYEHEVGLDRDEKRSMLFSERAVRSEKAAYRARAGASAAEPSRRTPRLRGHVEHRVELHTPNGHHALEVLEGDVTAQAVDAIVNPSNRGLFGTAGVDGAVHAKGGPELTAACRAIGGIDIGEAVVTGGYRLPASNVIHTTTLPWRGGGSGELEALRTAYTNVMALARRLQLRSIAFPAIGTGTYAYPREAATDVAVEAVVSSLERHGGPASVCFVLQDPVLARTYRRALDAHVPGRTPTATPSA